MNYTLKRYILPILCIVLGSFSPINSFAQLQVSGIPQTIPSAPQSYQQMIQQLFGNGVVVSNLVINCDTAQEQAGWFVATGTNLNLTQGLLLTSGDINQAVGPNNQTGASGAVNTLTGGDSDLDNISSATTYNSCGIEFDLVPYCDTISLRYVFGSEEYMEWANTSFNDVFGFFITGPNPLGGNYTTFNIAKIPGTATPVSIDNVNCNFNNAYYVCNEPSSVGSCNLASCPASATTTTLQYDGFTAVLDAVAAVIPCQSYHIKIAVADAGDGALDSGVFLEAGGVQCSSGLINVGVGNSINAGGNIAVEGCVDGVFTFSIAAPSAVNDTFNFIIGGTAQPNGVDYTGTMPSQVIIPAGQTTVTIPVPIVSDGIPEPVETILLIYIDSSLCGSQVFVDTFTLDIVDNPISDAGPDQTFCSGDTINIGGNSPVGYTYTWTPTAGVGNITSPNTTLTLINTTAAAITYSYILNADALLGVCGASDTALITVNPSVTAAFISTNACEGLPNTFTNQSSASSIAYSWFFGDNTSSNLANPTHVYADSGVYNVTLIAFPQAGCPDTITHQVTVYPKPVANFTAPPVCFPFSTQFTDATTAAVPNAWAWTFSPGGATSNLQNPTYTYPAFGTYNAELIVTTADGCKDTVVKPVSYNAQVFADFTTNNVCYGFTASFSNASNAPATIYAWDFGDPAITTDVSVAQNPTYFYNQAGTYNVTLISTSSAGCADTIQKQITIYPSPVANFAAPAVCNHLPSAFTDLSLSAVGWDWAFADGNSSVMQNPTHTYVNDGIYPVTLIVTSLEGCKDTVTQNVEVYKLPVATFQAIDGCIVDAVAFTYTGQNGTGNVNSFIWNFGDASALGSGAYTTHIYPVFGPYNVTLYISDDLSCKDTVQKAINTFALPIPNFTMQNTCEETELDFTNLSTIPQGTIASQTWTFGDNLTSTDLNPKHTYQNAGIFPVKLTTTSDHNCVTSLVKDIVIYPRPDITFENTSECEGNVTLFTDKTTLGPIVANDILTNWLWNLGDGSTDTNRNPEHLYANAGLYNVSLTVTTDKGCARTYTKSINVFPRPANPEIVNDTACFGNGVNLFAATFVTTDKMYWYSNPLDSLPFHIGSSYIIPQLLSDQVYFVQTHSATGCVSEKVPIQASVYPENPAYIQIANTILETPQAVAELSVISLVPMTTYNWNFGDKTTSTLATPSHEYPYPGMYQIEVKCSDENGCTQSLYKNIEVKEVYGVQVPSIFSPNGDNSNDEFYIGNYQIAQFQIGIYDRWGGEVFSSNDPSFRWDGKKNGKDVPEGIYVYKIKGVSSQNKKIEKAGSITLVR